MEKIIVIVGQTASGKTSLSLKIAKALNGEIINGDALQVYKELNIVTDKILDSQMENIPHHLFNIKSINENYSVEQYQHNIRKIINEVLSRKKIPIVVGGSGLYIKAALYDYNFSKENISNQEIEKKYANKTNDELYELLYSIDPESCKNIHKNNRRRVLRAIAIYEQTGIKKSTNLKNQNHEMIYDALLIGLDQEKEIINKKIDERIEKMFAEGIVEEIKNNPTNTTASKAIGYSEITAYLENKISLNEAKELMKIHTHQYSKRQKTWFKNQLNVSWFYNDDNALKDILALIEKWLNN